MHPSERGISNDKINITPRESDVLFDIVDDIGDFQAFLYLNGVNAKPTLYIPGSESHKGSTSVALIHESDNEVEVVYTQTGGEVSLTLFNTRGSNGLSIDNYDVGENTDLAIAQVRRVLMIMYEKGNEEALSYLLSFGFSDSQLKKVLSLIQDLY
jgi:hypothetical protein